jgi:hypothetical protein
MTTAYTPNKKIEQPAYNDYAGDPTGWTTPVNTNWATVDTALGGNLALSATGSVGTVNLTITQTRNLIITITGAMTGDALYTLPLNSASSLIVGGQWIINNKTTGNHTVTFSPVSGGGASVVCQQGVHTCIYSDGTDVALADDRPYVPPADSVDTAAIEDGAVTYDKIDPASIASAADFRANTADRLLDTAGTWASGALVALTDATIIAVDLSAGFNFSVTLAGNRTLGNPTNPKVGQTGIIQVTQDGTGGRTLAFQSNYKFAGATPPVISTDPNSITVFSYIVLASSFVVMTAITGVG